MEKIYIVKPDEELIVGRNFNETEAYIYVSKVDENIDFHRLFNEIVKFVKIKVRSEIIFDPEDDGMKIKPSIIFSKNKKYKITIETISEGEFIGEKIGIIEEIETIEQVDNINEEYIELPESIFE